MDSRVGSSYNFAVARGQLCGDVQCPMIASFNLILCMYQVCHSDIEGLHELSRINVAARTPGRQEGSLT